MNRLVRSATLFGFPELARSFGLDPWRLLAEADIPRSALDGADSLISASATCRLLEASAAASGVEDFGLRMCENRHLSILGPLGMVVRDASTLHEALVAMVSYLSLHSEAAILEIEEEDAVFVLRLSLMVEGGGPVRQATEMVLGALYRMLGELLGPGWRAREICLSHAAPGQTATHRRVFGSAITFGHDFNGIVGDRRDLAAALPGARPELARYAREYADTLLAQRHHSLAEKVQRMVFSLLRTGHCSIEQVAGRLGIDRRTVHRRLMLEGTTFSAIQDEVRRALAFQYLGERDRSVSYVADQLGFSMPSAFTRWFHRHAGCSPSRWRARYLSLQCIQDARKAPSL